MCRTPLQRRRRATVAPCRHGRTARTAAEELDIGDVGGGVDALADRSNAGVDLIETIAVKTLSNDSNRLFLTQTASAFQGYAWNAEA